MILFSIIQFFANGWRAVQWWRYVRWRIFWLLLPRRRARVRGHAVDRVRAGQGAGLPPARADAVRGRSAAAAACGPNIEWRGVPFVTGVLTTVMQFLAGVGGLFLDIFFQKSMLDRKTTLATKAVTQTASHVAARGLFRARSDRSATRSGSGRSSAAIVLAIAGTALAPYVIERMTDHGFRQWTRAIIFSISAVYLVRAGWLFWHG